MSTAVQKKEELNKLHEEIKLAKVAIREAEIDLIRMKQGHNHMLDEYKKLARFF
jgi:hypothetical protein